VLHAPLFATLDALLSVVDGDVGRHHLAAAWGRLSTSLGRTKHGNLLADVMLGGDATRLLECVPEKVAMLTLEQVLCAVLGQCANAPLASLVVGLGLHAPTMPPQRA
jgi:hypothetical protein